MIEVIDRLPTYPGRVKLIPVPGQPDTYDMIRADEPLVAGTPINRALFESISVELDALHQNVANLINSHASVSPIGSLPAGAEFGIYENNILVPFIKVSGDYNGTGRSAVMRKHIYKRDFLTTSDQNNVYANSLTDTWLNTEYLSMLDSYVRGGIANVAVPSVVGDGDSTLEEIQRKVFLASLTEMGLTDDWYSIEGTPFPYFNSYARRKALFNGSAMFYWTRSPHYSYTNMSAYINGDGTHSTDSAYSLQAGIRPLFTLPHDFEVNMTAASATNVAATAEVI